jgi:hypothetical protein
MNPDDPQYAAHMRWRQSLGAPAPQQMTLGGQPMRLEDTLAEVDRLPFMRMVY